MDEGVIITFMQWESKSKGRETRLIEEGRSVHCSSAPLCSLLLKFQTREKVPRAALDVAGYKRGGGGSDKVLFSHLSFCLKTKQKTFKCSEGNTKIWLSMFLCVCVPPFTVSHALHSEINSFQMHFPCFVRNALLNLEIQFSL